MQRKPASGEQHVMTEAQPWPAPWTYEVIGARARVIDADGSQVISGMMIAKAERIIAAVNAHDDLVTALEMFCALPDGYFKTVKARCCYQVARAALAKART
jgi:hypothetical protein